jgi:hypothetical protein
MRRMLVMCAAVGTAATAWAHEGHGQALPHLHDHEWSGLLLAAAIGVGVWWWSRRGGDR